MSLFNRVNSGGIILSYQCTNRCLHCLYNSRPESSKWLEYEDLYLLFQNISSFGAHLSGFHIAGGEPFLKPDLIIEALRLVKKFKIPIEYIETNGFWGDYSNKYRKYILEFKKLGLNNILISLSPFHTEFILLNTIMNAIKLAEDILGKDGVFIWIPDFFMMIAEKGENRRIRISEYGDMRSFVEIVSEKYNVIYGGRAAYNIGRYVAKYKVEHFYSENCFVELFKTQHVHFDSFYNYIPTFCSGISLGDWRNLGDMYNNFNIEKYPFISKISKNFKHLLDFAHSYGFKSNKLYASKCHLCIDIRNFLISKDDFLELKPEYFYKEFQSNNL